MNQENHGKTEELPPPPPTLLEEQTKTAFDIFSYMPFRRNTPMEVTVKHNQRDVDFDRPPLVSAANTDGDTYCDEPPKYNHDDEEDDDYHHNYTCFNDWTGLFGLDQQDRATLDAASQSYDSRGTFEDEVAIKAAMDAARRKNRKYMYYRKPSQHFENEDV